MTRRVVGSGPAAGGVLGGRYQLLVPMASGGMGSIWAARQIGSHTLHSLVAVKIAHPQFASQEKFEHMFLDEARLASAIRHPNVCSVFDLGQDGESLFLVMEWIGGGSLHELLDAVPNRRLEPRIAARILAGACAGLHAAHELRDESGAPMNLIHRDVSPQNILITALGQVKLTDFGVARANDQLHEATSTGEVKGKLAYMAPEQFSSRHYDRRVDVFSIGCVFYRALVGKRAFDDTGPELLYSVLHLKFDPPRSVVPDIPEELERIVLKAMSPVENRYASAEEMRRDLEQWLSTQPPCLESEVAQIVNESLSKVIERRRTSVDAVKSEIDSDTFRVDVDTLAAGTSDNRHPSDPTKLVKMNSDLSETSASHGSLVGTLPMHAIKPPRTRMALAFGAALVAIGGATVWRMSTRDAHTSHDPASTASNTALIATVPAGADTSRPNTTPEIRTVAITIQTNVAGATASFDDATPESTPLRRVFARDEKNHILRVRAPGYVMEKRDVAFTEPLDLSIVLRPVTTVHGSQTKTVTPAAPTSSTPAVTAKPPSSADPFEKPLTTPGIRRRPIDSEDPFKKD